MVLKRCLTIPLYVGYDNTYNSEWNLLCYYGCSRGGKWNFGLLAFVIFITKNQ